MNSSLLHQIAPFAIAGVLAAQALPCLAAPTSYADLSVTTSVPAKVATTDTVRFYVAGSGCRSSSQDVAPSRNGSTIDFVLTFSGTCFATPPAFLWSGDLAPLPAGEYTVRYFRRTSTGTTAPPGAAQLVATRQLVVAERPRESGLALSSGAADPSFGINGVARMPSPWGFLVPMRAERQSGNRIVINAAAPSAYSGVTRFLASGAVDSEFGAGGSILGDHIVSGPVMAVAPTDEIVLGHDKYDNDGTRNAAISIYSPDGQLQRTVAFRNELAKTIGDNTTDVAVDRNGRILAAVASSGTAPVCTRNWALFRFDLQGRIDTTFGNNGAFRSTFPGCVYRLALAPDGSIFAVGSDWDPTPATFIAKLTADGSIDASFGNGGIAKGSFARVKPAPQDDGGVLVGTPDFSLVRLRADGTPDPAFGSNGVVANPTDTALWLEDFAVDDTGIVLVGSVARERVLVSPAVLYEPVVVRYRPDGTLQTSFGDDGVAHPASALRMAVNAGLQAVALVPVSGAKHVMVMGETVDPGTASQHTGWMLQRFQSGGIDVAAIEYYHADYDHYFVTSDPVEIAQLDAGAFARWQRTGESFDVFGAPWTQTVDVCRFFSTAFAPKSSHFYTADAAECAGVMKKPEWLFEGRVFQMRLPDAPGQCPATTEPIYRLYNNGQGQAPNHRYTRSAAIQARMVQQGWIAEGVAMCAPR